MIGLAHFSVAFAFFVGSVLIDLDHRPFIIKDLARNIFKNCDTDTIIRRGKFHSWYFFYLLCAATLGVFIHLKMDGIL